MPARVNLNQLAFSFSEPTLPWLAAPPAPEVPTTTPAERQAVFYERLVDAGLASSVHELERNSFLTVPPKHRRGETWGLPSRLFRYGFRLMNRWDHLGVRIAVHTAPMLCHPFVDVVRALGFDVGLDPTDQLPGWHHAVDLMTDEHYEDLLRTRQHVSPEQVAGAVSRALLDTRFQVPNARAVMGEMGWREPQGRSTELLRGQELQPMRADGGIAPNPMSCGPDGAWMMIHALEDGWIARGRDGYGRMTPEGMARRAA